MLKELLNHYVTNDAKVWEHDRSLTIGASEIGICARKNWYGKHKSTKDLDHEDRWGATRRGDLIERHLFVPALQARFGDKLLFAGKDQKTFKEGHISATPDAVVIGLKRDVLAHLGVKDIGGDCILIECKTADPRTNLEKAKAQHAYQVQQQMGLVRLKTKYKPNYSLLVYIDASFHDEITEFAIPFDQKTFDGARARADLIMTAQAAKDLKPEGYIAGGGECDHCAFKDACGIERHNLPSEKWKDKPVDPQRVAEMTDMCKNAKTFEVERDAADAKLKNAQEEIRNRLREWDIRKIPGVVSLAGVKGRMAYDNSKIREAAIAAGVDVEQFSSVGEPTSRLTISV